MTKPEPAGRPPILASATETWSFLEHQGGLDTDFYDAPIIAALRSTLQLSEGEDIAAGLTRKSVSVEDFVAAFFQAVQPYTRMMTDLLNLFAEAGAQSSDHNLALEFDFGRQLKLDFDLRQFRQWLTEWSLVPHQAIQIRWSSNALWELNGTLRQNPFLESDPHGMDAEGTEAQAWAREYRAGHWPATIPASPLTGHGDLDRALLQVWHLWSTVLRESARIGPDRAQLQETWRQARRNDREDLPERRDRENGGNGGNGGNGPEEMPEERREEPADQEEAWPLGLLASLDSDLWALSVASALYAIPLLLAEMTPSDRRAFPSQMSSAIDDVVGRRPRRIIDVQTWEQTLHDFLNLPVWQRRHELYSAWIWTQIVAALNDYGRRIHQDDGHISFSFAGSHLATFPRLDPELHIWAELRSPLAETPWGKGRKGKIQPDYTVVHSPITSKDSAVVVVECKQYRAASTANFLHALVDYAHGRPTARVILVNYGPARQDILAAAPDEIRSRISLIGELFPGAPAVAEFHEAVRAAITLRYPTGETTSEPPSEPEPTVKTTKEPASDRIVLTMPPVIKKIVLTWNEGPNDLDLHLSADQDGLAREVSFHTKGSLEAQPWAALDQDARRGASETITISRLTGRYRCLVHNYSNDEPLTKSLAEVRIEHAAGILTLTCPQDGDGRYWHIFSFDAGSGRLEILNTLSDSQ
jgi:hypothetical protein